MTIARARGMTEVARASGLTREALTILAKLYWAVVNYIDDKHIAAEFSASLIFVLVGICGHGILDEPFIPKKWFDRPSILCKINVPRFLELV